MIFLHCLYFLDINDPSLAAVRSEGGRAREYDRRASPPFPHNGIKSLSQGELLELLDLLMGKTVNWKDVANERLRNANQIVRQFVQQHADKMLAALASTDPINSAFNAIPRTSDANCMAHAHVPDAGADSNLAIHGVSTPLCHPLRRMSPLYG